MAAKTNKSESKTNANDRSKPIDIKYASPEADTAT